MEQFRPLASVWEADRETLLIALRRARNRQQLSEGQQSGYVMGLVDGALSATLFSSGPEAERTTTRLHKCVDERFVLLEGYRLSGIVDAGVIAQACSRS